MMEVSGMKAARHAIILELIEKHEIETQEELAENGKYKYATVDRTEAGLKERFTRIFSQTVLSVTSAGNIIVLKTINGSANAAAEAIDFLKWTEIAGTLAGDNTIFLAVKDSKLIPELMKKIHSMMKS